MKRRRCILARKTGGGIEPVPMPAGFTQVEYVDSDGGQFVETGVTAAATVSSELDIMFLATEGGPYTVLSDGSSNYGTNYGQYNGVFSIFSSYQSTAPSDVRTKVRCYIRDGYQNIDAAGSYISFPYSGSTNTYKLFAAAGWMGSAGSVRLWRGIFIDDETQVCDLVPCRDEDHVGYLYDAVNDVIRPSTGPRPLIPGPDVV